MEELTLEQEFMARAFMHKVTIAGGLLAKTYIDDHKEKFADVPEEIIEKLGHEFAQKVIHDTMQKGTFDELYNDAWDVVSEGISDNFSITINML